MITRALLELINVDTGRPVVRRVIRADDVLERSEGDSFPDLFVEWDRSAPIERVWSPTIGTVYAPYEHWRTGDHHDRGLLLATGRGIAAGRRADSMDLTEIAPTLAAAIGEELDEVDGRPRLDLVGARSPAANAAVATEEPTLPAPYGRPRRRPWRLPLGASASNRRRIDADQRIAEGALDLAHAAVVRAQEVRADLEREAAASAWRRRPSAGASTTSTGPISSGRRCAGSTRSPWRRTASSRSSPRPTNGPRCWRPPSSRCGRRPTNGGRWSSSTTAATPRSRSSPRSATTACGRCGSSTAGRRPPATPALAAATGTVITYLDDDNTLDPGWLKAIAWAFQQHPEAEVLYGARMVDDRERVHKRGEGGWPWLQFNEFDRDRLEQGNLADMGALAHVAGLPEARFDERLREFADWDLFLSLTEHRTPLELPAIAVYYRTEGQGPRLTGAHPDDVPIVLEKWAGRRAARGAERPPAD